MFSFRRCLIKTKLSANSKSSSLNLGSVSVYLAMLRMSNGVSNAFALCPMSNIFTGFDVAFLIVALCGEYSHWPCMIPCDTEDSQCKEHVFNPP